MSYERLKQFIDEKRIVRGKWNGTDKQGRHVACLLAAISPEVDAEKSSGACPADIMPAWMAYLTPWIDDSGAEENWWPHVLKYADLAKRWHILTPAAWERAYYRVQRESVIEARRPTKNSNVLKICENVISLLDRAIIGDLPKKVEWDAAAAAADAAAAATHYAARYADDAAADAAAAATRYAARYADAAARYAAHYAAAAADAAAAAQDRIIEGIFAILEDEISKAGG